MVIKQLVSTGQARIDIRDHRNGFTPLHYACKSGHLECVSVLISLGADPSASTETSGNGYLTPLMLASQAGFDDIVSVLLHHNADVMDNDSNFLRASDHAEAMAGSLTGTEASRRRDCEVILRVQDDPVDPLEYYVPKRNVRSYSDVEADMIVSISAGGSTRVVSSFGLALSGRGTLWTYGHNDKGQAFRGLDKTTDFSRWRRCEDLRKYKRRVSCIAAGGEHALCVLDTGHVVGVGSNFNGQLGTGDGKSVRVPQPLDLTVKATSVACGAHHSAIIMAGGGALTMGLNRNGQLGDGTRADRFHPIEVPMFLEWNARFKRVECGSAHTLWIDTENNVWNCGWAPGDSDDLKPVMVRTDSGDVLKAIEVSKLNIMSNTHHFIAFSTKEQTTN